MILTILATGGEDGKDMARIDEVIRCSKQGNLRLIQ